MDNEKSTTASLPKSVYDEIRLATPYYSIEEIWNLYKEFCVRHLETQNERCDSAPAFLGWLEKYHK